MRCKPLALSCLLISLLAASPLGAQPLFSPSQDPVAGERVFGAKGCVKCHAVRGVGGKIGPDLARTSRPRTFYDLAAALWNHAPRMAARMRQLRIERPHLDARETADLAAYLFTLSYFDQRGSVAAGRGLFIEKRCSVCHAAGRTGGAVGPRLDGLKAFASPIYLATAMWNHGPQMAQTMQREQIERPTFRTSELVNLIAYINSVSPKRSEGALYVLPGRADQGRRLFAEKRCVECHKLDDRGDAPDLTARATQRSLTEFVAAMWNKAPAMTAAMQAKGIPVPQLKPEEMADLVAFLYSARYFKQAGDPHRGVIVAVNKGCLNCHGLYGERGKVAGDLNAAPGLETPAGVLSTLWNHSFIAAPALEREKAPWPTFTGEEMADLVAYLRSLKRAR